MDDFATSLRKDFTEIVEHVVGLGVSQIDWRELAAAGIDATWKRSVVLRSLLRSRRYSQPFYSGPHTPRAGERARCEA